MAVSLEHDSEDVGSNSDSDDPLRGDAPAGTGWGRAQRPGPAPAPAGEADDPIASLFTGSKAVPAPAIPETPSESELKRWNATVRSSSLFDESVVDPPPSAQNARSGARPRAAVQAPEVRAVQSTAVGRNAPPLETHEPEFDAPMAAPAPIAPAPAGRKTAQMIAAPAPAPVAPPPAAAAPPPPAPAGPAPSRKKKDRASGRSGMRNKRAEAQPMESEGLAGSEEARSAAAAPVDIKRKRGIARGPNKIMLVAVGLGALLSIGTAAVVIGLIPSPIPLGFAGDPNAAIANEPAVAAKAAAKPVAAAPVAKPVNPAPAAAAPAQPAAAAAPAPAPAKPTKAEAPALAAAAPAAKPAPAAVAPAAPAPATKPAAAPVAEADSDSTLGADADRLIMAANKKLAADDAAGAEALMRQGLAHDPDDHHLMEVLVRALIEQDRGAEAVPLARKMVKKRSKRVPYRLLLGDALLMVGDQAGARAEWQTAYELDPKDRQVRMRLGK
jgi:2-oxoglutarate dehydrogenase E2 component (dihydrolipoamide succinyltransferase)